MSLDCPACGKASQADPVCSRCGSDLSRLRAVAQSAALALREGRNALEQTDWKTALACASRSWALCHSRESARLAFLSAAALRQTARALEWRQRCETE